MRKLHDLAEAEASNWRPPGPALWREIAALWRFSARLAPRSLPPGVHKYRSVDDPARAALAEGRPGPAPTRTE